MTKTIQLIGVLLLLFNLSCSSDKQQTIIKLAHGLDTNHSVHKAMVFMNELLEKESNGKMSIEIYANQQLGSERECLELLQIGSLDMTKVSTGVMENFAPKMRIFGLPYLFRNREHQFNVLDGVVGKELLENGKNFWLKGMGYYDAGSRSFYTKDKPVENPSDLEGLKIRVMESVTAINMVKKFGGSPTPISWGELYTSLQQGVVDGAENNPPSFYLSRHYEVCKFYSLDEHTALPDVLLISTHTWEKLSEQERVWLQKSVDESIKYQRKLWADAEETALLEVEKAGVTILRPDKSSFIEKVNSLYSDAELDKDIKVLIQKIKNID
ncbi:MAG: TRAP transporter substrate-binding protein [Flavobacteriaceae bacterium]|jgi:tripartite ATP-independent transporter DctP family solute receptor|nr:TRAP transporter substrate-binding protein [Flavobacteriaceae bacterium]